jgi:hypothetical protein
MIRFLRRRDGMVIRLGPIRIKKVDRRLVAISREHDFLVSLFAIPFDRRSKPWTISRWSIGRPITLEECVELRGANPWLLDCREENGVVDASGRIRLFDWGHAPAPTAAEIRARILAFQAERRRPGR